ncbi:MAG TPA: DUF1048 domain-containing protein [Pseudonocardiaceae bacterium]|nr:DUF1048 domain-containing protein [Pseudonocardiaceae bacterium]
MNFWETITGNDLTREFKGFETRAEALPADYRAAWQQIKANLWPYGDFTGRNLIPILDGVLGLLEETAADGLNIHDVIDEDIGGFCVALAGGKGARSHRDRWREQLNRNVARKLAQLGADVGIQDIIEGKKQWRAHLARVKALPPDYQIVYKEIQRYLFKIGPIDLSDGKLLSGIVDFFAEGAAGGKGVLELIGSDVAAFCDDLIKGSRTYADVYQESISRK